VRAHIPIDQLEAQSRCCVAIDTVARSGTDEDMASYICALWFDG
jgi:hypothetical protein